jgi:hypothetical protein
VLASGGRELVVTDVLGDCAFAPADLFERA